MTDTTAPPEPDEHTAPTPATGGAATRLAASVSERGFDVDPDGDGVPHAGLRLGGLIAALVLLGFVNPWMLVVILALVVMITLHELGHYVMAKRAGMKVTEFFLGFGPKIWSTRRGETEYGIKLIPAGAYVKIIGMTNLEEVDPADEARSYRQKTFGQRVGVAVAGSTMHFILAIVLIFAALSVVGQPGGTLDGKELDRRWRIGSVVDGSGADAAGLRVDDKILSIDGEPVEVFDDIPAIVAPLRGEGEDPADLTVPVVFQRDGREQTVSVTLATFSSRGRTTWGLGVGTADPPKERLNPLEGAIEAPVQFGKLLGTSVAGLGSFLSPSGITDFADQVGSAREDRAALTADEEEPTSSSSASSSSTADNEPSENRVMSIVGLVRFGSDAGEANPSSLVLLFAYINIFIGAFNLLPLLPFDGGHVLIAVYERIQERRLRRRRYFTDVARLLPLTYGVVILLGMLFVSSIYLDLANPLVIK